MERGKNHMKVYSLSAAKPIVKKYILNKNRELEKTPYPLVSEFTSTEHEVQTIEDLYTVTQAVANTQGCLLKGTLLKTLKNESRAGSTRKDAETEWICLDLDGVGILSPDAMLKALGCDEVDYVLQWSSSMGLEGNHDLRCHIFMLLDKPVAPARLKLWLLNANLNIKTLADSIQLAKSENALKWPLDVSTCQNDKLIYVAPPQLGKTVKDPFAGRPRITLEKREYERLAVDLNSMPTNGVIRASIDAKVAELRKAAGLPKRKKSTFKFAGSIEYLAGAASATITDMKAERGFVYFNLNGGDSWAYYHPENNAEFIFNFKGEPTYKTEELLPEYWHQLQEQNSNGNGTMNSHLYMGFNDSASGKYWKVTYAKDADQLQIDPAPTRQHIKDFLKSHGMPAGDFIPDWTIVFDPHSPVRVDPEQKLVNTYSPQGLWATTPKPSAVLPPITRRIIDHVLGGDPATIEAFLNWVACVFQYREPTMTAWILHGTEGTGKGILFHRILAPIIGTRYTRARRFDELDSSFVDWVDGVFLTMIDEIQQGHVFWQSKVTAKLKNLIVEPEVNSRQMYVATKTVKNYNNLIFASNKPAPVDISPNDRRFNVGMYQSKRLQITRKEVEELLPKELEQVYGYFMTRVADKDKARVPHINVARTQMIMTNALAIDEVAKALNNGDLKFFWDERPSSKSSPGVPIGPQQLREDAYVKLIKDLVNTQRANITRDELRILCDYCVGGMPDTPTKFTKLLGHHEVKVKEIWHDKQTMRGVTVNWVASRKWLLQAQKDIAAGLV